MVVRATDKGNPPLSDDAQVVVTVTDFNDNRPVLDQSSVSVTIAEDTTVGTGLTTITGSDVDLGESGRVLFSLVSTSGPFILNSGSGLVSTNGVFDREDTDQFTIVVQAVDNGTIPLTSTSSATITVSITDVNDNAPVFSNTGSCDVSISEATAQSTTVFTVAATDQDLGTNAAISFELAEADGVFEISEQGVVTLEDPLDREIKDSFVLRVTGNYNAVWLMLTHVVSSS